MSINARQIALALILGVLLAASACSGSRGRQTTSSPTPVPAGQVPTTSAPTSTPIPAPRASFVVDRGSGPAPLIVQFTNRSRTAVGFTWDFGDGTTSNEHSPVHIYTKAGQWTVRLTATDLDRSRDRSDVATSTAITVGPGPLAKLALEPVDASVEAGNPLRFKTLAEDAYGNTITDLSSSWAVRPEAGRITPDGLLDVGTRAGFYPAAVKLSASYGAGSLTATANLTILAGPLASAKITPSGTSIFTGDSVTLQLEAADRFGNQATPTSVVWNVDPGRGSVTGGQASAIFRAGRQAGIALLGVQARDSRGAILSTIPLTVQQGFCNTNRVKAEWKAQWWALNSDGSRGAFLGTSALPSTFTLDWQRGEVFSGRSEQVRLEADTQMVLRRQGPVRFTVGGDDGYRLLLNERPVIDDGWSSHSYRRSSVIKLLDPGVYSLHIDYYEWTDLAKLTFDMDADPLSWDEITECRGAYVQAPQVRYSIFRTGDSTTAVADKFGISPAQTARAVLNNTPIFFVEGRPDSHRKIIILQGIDSYANCTEVTVEPRRQGSPSTRADTLASSIQSWAWVTSSDVSSIDRRDLVAFSYSDSYQQCLPLPLPPFNSHTMPVDGSAVATYVQSDTCQGVASAANKLRQLVDRLIQDDGRVQIDLVGHSLGGMVAGYFMISQPSDIVSKYIGRVITIDSPLSGTLDRNPFSQCPEASQSWIDISGASASQIVPQIRKIPTSQVSNKVYSINNSPVGENGKLTGLPTAPIFIECGAESGSGAGAVLGGAGGAALLGPLGFFIGAILGGDVGGKVVGHSCAWTDATSMAQVAAFLSR